MGWMIDFEDYCLYSLIPMLYVIKNKIAVHFICTYTLYHTCDILNLLECMYKGCTLSKI
jgi:hypothetical protein